MESTYRDYIAIKNEIDFKNALKKHFFQDNVPFFGFKKITIERKKEIEAKATFWRSLQGNVPFLELFYKTLYEINHKRKKSISDSEYFYLERGDESYLFFISAFDPNLDILKIFLEESKKSEIQRRFKEEFGFPYDDRLRQIEMYYNKRFPTVVDEFEPKL